MTDVGVPHVAQLPTKLGKLGGKPVVCVLCGKGEANAATALQDVFAQWRPRWVLLTGIAGGFPQVNVTCGDVVIGKFVYCVDFGKVTDGRFLRRPEYDYTPDRKLLAHAELIAETNRSWTTIIDVRRPDGKATSKTMVHVGYIASSDKVVDDADGNLYKTLRGTIPELHAVEMEASGAGASVRLEQGKRTVGFLMIRGISDEVGVGDHKSPVSLQRASWKRYASSAAAAFIQTFLQTYPSSDAPKMLASARVSLKTSAGLVFDHQCQPCFGRGYYGYDPVDTCGICQGRGHFYISGEKVNYERCRPCKATGHFGIDPRNTCSVCHGWGIVTKPSTR